MDNIFDYTFHEDYTFHTVQNQGVSENRTLIKNIETADD